MNLNNILIGSDNADRLSEYYTKVLGAPRMSEGGYTTWVIGTGAVTVGPHSEVHGSNDQPGRLMSQPATGVLGIQGKRDLLW